MRNHKYEYKEIEKYKEEIELSQLKKSTTIVNVAILILCFPLIYLLITLDYEVQNIIYSITPLVILIIINYFFRSYEENSYNYLTFLMYLNTFGIFLFCINIIYTFQTPSIFASLFLAYAITTVYKDFKVIMIANVAIFASAFFFVFNYPDVFTFTDSGTTQIYVIFILLFLFAVLLSITFYIFIQRKLFFHDNISDIKEYEYRNLDLIFELQESCNCVNIDYNIYYDKLYHFFERIKMQDEERENILVMIDILKDINNGVNADKMLEKYPDYTIKELRGLKTLGFNNKKIRKMGIKASQSLGVYDLQKKRVSKNEYKTLNHLSDSLEVKIIAFSVFYTMLKIDKPYLFKLSEEEIYDFFHNSKYKYYINNKVLKIYLDNNMVFDTIIKDNIYGEGE